MTASALTQPPPNQIGAFIFLMIYQFPYEWSKVTQANWLKYPNSSSSHVIHVDVLSREVTDCGILRTERVIACRQPIPEWIKRVREDIRMLDSHISPRFSISVPLRTLGRSVKWIWRSGPSPPSPRTSPSLALWLWRKKSNIHRTQMTAKCRVAGCEWLMQLPRTVLEQDFKITALGCYPRLKAMLEDICMQRFISNAEKVGWLWVRII